MYTPASINEARERIKTGKAACVLMHGGVIVGEASGMGVKPILQFLENEPDLLKGADAADKVIGKAAAILLVLGGVQYVYGEIMSEAGRDFLKSHGVACSCGRLVARITSRDGTGMCPLEMSVADIDDPQAGYKAIKETIAVLMAKT